MDWSWPQLPPHMYKHPRSAQLNERLRNTDTKTVAWLRIYSIGKIYPFNLCPDIYFFYKSIAPFQWGDRKMHGRVKIKLKTKFSTRLCQRNPSFTLPGAILRRFSGDDHYNNWTVVFFTPASPFGNERFPLTNSKWQRWR